jgi:outer membrane protein TolC
MKRAAALLALIATACTTMEPKLGQPDAAIPPSWPAGSAALTRDEASLPTVTYKQIFTDVRLQTLIAQALVNNRDLMIAASNIAATREQYRIQRAQQLPTVDAAAGTTVSGDKSKDVSAQYQLGVNVPSWDIDLFGRLRSLSHAQLAQYLATEAGARSTRLALVAQDVNALQLLVGAPIDPSLLPASIDQAAPTIGELPAGLDSYVLLRRPDVVEAEFQLRAANAQIGAARAALFPRISLTGLLGLASSALTSLFTGGAFGWQASAGASYTIFNAGASKANVRLTEAQRQAAVATYQKAIQTAFREVSDALARRGTMADQLSARQRQQAAAADYYLLSEARYKAGVDNFLSTLDAQRSYYSAQQLLVQTKLIAAQNLVDLYQSLGGDSLLDASATGQTRP